MAPAGAGHAPRDDRTLARAPYPSFRTWQGPDPRARSGARKMRTAMWRVKRKQWEPFAFASPSLVLIALVIVFPLGYSFYLSLQNFDLSVGPEYEYVGAKNYVEAV